MQNPTAYRTNPHLKSSAYAPELSDAYVTSTAIMAERILVSVFLRASDYKIVFVTVYT